MDLKSFLGHIMPISVYDDVSDSDKFKVGFLVRFTERYALFNCITTRGYEDGYYLTLVDDIYRIDTNSQYLEKIYALWNGLKQKRKDVFAIKSDVITDLLAYSQENELIVSIFLFEQQSTSITCSIKEISDDTIICAVVDDYGRDDGTTHIQKADIVRIYCNSGNERNLQYLREISVTLS
jgi:hypothetical protein